MHRVGTGDPKHIGQLAQRMLTPSLLQNQGRFFGGRGGLCRHRSQWSSTIRTHTTIGNGEIPLHFFSRTLLELFVQQNDRLDSRYEDKKPIRYFFSYSIKIAISAFKISKSHLQTKNPYQKA